MTLKSEKETKKRSITIGFLVESNRERLRLTSLTGDLGYDKEITDKNIHRPGLALAGFVHLFRYDRVQVFGNTEVSYLEQLEPAQRRHALETILGFNVPCVVVTSDNKVDDILLKTALAKKVPVLRTPFETTKFIYIFSDFLAAQFSST